MQIGGHKRARHIHGPNYHRRMHPTALRALVVAAILAILAVASVPLLILLDLSGDGTGWGICEAGIESCRVGNFRGPRLAVVLMIVLIALVALLRFVVWVAGMPGRRRQPDRYQRDDIFIP